jgi:hypothetical protein
MGLIVLQPLKRFKDQKFKYFVNIQRWIEIKELFSEEAFNLYHISRPPILQNVL